MLMTLGLYRLWRHRHPRFGGMQVSFRDLTIWSFLMASAHGAGFMVIPFVMQMPTVLSAGSHDHAMHMLSGGTNVTAGANSMLQALNGVVGTQAAPMRVNVNPGTLSIRATTAVAGVSAFLTGTVLPGNTLTLLNVPPGLVCCNVCPGPPSNNPFAGFSGLIPLFTYDSIVPWYLHEPSDPPMISVFATYLPKSVVTEAEVDVKSNEKSVSREIPPCFPASACKPAATSFTNPVERDGVTAR
jgi:hypothetical protein